MKEKRNQSYEELNATVSFLGLDIVIYISK